MPRRGMAYERGVMIIANPYTEDMLKKYNSMELLLPKTGEVIHICKLPQSLYTPGRCLVASSDKSLSQITYIQSDQTSKHLETFVKGDIKVNYRLGDFRRY